MVAYPPATGPAPETPERPAPAVGIKEREPSGAEVCQDDLSLGHPTEEPFCILLAVEPEALERAVVLSYVTGFRRGGP